MRKTVLDRFWGKVNKTETCWVWQPPTQKGYGYFSLGGKQNNRNILAHRFSVLITGRNLPEGLQVDHLCKNKACVNPEHLEVVTPRVNTLRSNNVASLNAKKVNCLRGHNRWGNQTNGRKCLECLRLQEQSRRNIKVVV